MIAAEDFNNNPAGNDPFANPGNNPYDDPGVRRPDQ
jgi:hypothetical protein